jgi:large subunit ribosomal protein L25
MLQAIVRDSIGKSGAAQLRRDGYLIANIYGNGVENIHCAFKKNDFIKAVKSKSTLIFPVDVNGKSVEVVIQEYQKDPVTNDFVHVDLLAVTKGKATRFKVPVKTSGIPVGMKNKGVIVFSKKRVKVKCKPEDLPNEFMLDISPLDVGMAILVRDLPQNEKVTILEKSADALVGVIKAK